MPRTVETTVFKYSELSDRAKEKARDWYITASQGDNFFAEYVFEYAGIVAEILGIEFNQRPVKLMGGGTRYEPAIYYSGFWSRGDGACFEGSYTYKKGAKAALLAHIGGKSGNDKELVRICEELQRVQKRHFYKLTATTSHRGHYYHSGCMSVEVEHCEDRYRDIGDAEDDIKQALRDFANWIYKQLQEAWEYENSDSNVAETIEANEYEFTEDGERA